MVIHCVQRQHNIPMYGLFLVRLIQGCFYKSLDYILVQEKRIRDKLVYCHIFTQCVWLQSHHLLQDALGNGLLKHVLVSCFD